MKKRIDEFLYKEKSESQLFDWVLTNIDSLNFILSNLNDDDLFCKNNFVNTNDYKYPNHLSYIHTHCHFVSIHDAYDDSSIVEGQNIVAEKYTRRLKRFRYLCNNKDDLVFFMIIDNENPINQIKMINLDDKIIELNKNIKNICNHSFKLYILHTLEKLENVDVDDNVVFINLIDYQIADMKTNNDWYRYYFDWKSIFNNH